MEKINMPEENIFDMIKRLDLGEKSILEVVTEIDKLRHDKVSLLSDVRRLVDEAKLLIESAEDSHSYCDCYEVATLLKCSRDTEKAIAAVDRHLETTSHPHSSPPPADTGRA